jgi:hypothetical protein
VGDDIHIDAKRIDDLNLVATRLGCFHQAPMGI